MSNARPGRGLIVKQMPGVCPEVMLTVGIDSHINAFSLSRLSLPERKGIAANIFLFSLF